MDLLGLGFGDFGYRLGGRPPCNSGMVGLQQDPNIILNIPYSHYYCVRGPLKNPKPEIPGAEPSGSATWQLVEKCASGIGFR